MILETRARALARRPDVDDSRDRASDLEVLLVRIGDATVGLTAHAVVAIVRSPVITPLPRASRPIFGLGAWRGRPLTVLTLDARHSLKSDAPLMVILGEGQRASGALLVDDVDDVVTLDRRALTTAPSGALTRFAIGVTPEAILVLDASLILDTARTDS